MLALAKVFLKVTDSGSVVKGLEMKFVFLLVILVGCGEVEFSSSMGDRGDTDKNALEGDATGERRGQFQIKIDTIPSSTDGNGGSNSNADDGGTTLRGVETPIDILLVIDNSSSMRRVNEVLRANFSSLIPDPRTNRQKIGANPWRIAITTSTATECLWAVMNKEDRDIVGHAAEFQRVLASFEHNNPSRTADQRTSTNIEQTVKMATRALAGELAIWDNTQSAGEECDGTASSWLREKSLLSVILISDEDANDNTQSASSRCGGSDATGCLKKLWNKIKEVRVPQRTAELYGMLHPRDNNAKSKADPTGSTIYKRWHNRKSEGSFTLYKPLYRWDGIMPQGGLYVLELADIVGGVQQISARIKKQTQLSYYLPDDHEVNKVYLLDGTNKQLLQPDGYHIEDGVLVLTTIPSTSTVGIEIQ